MLLLLVTNLLHAAVALLFCVGLRPFTGALSASRWSHLLGLGLTLPVLVPVLRLAGAPGLPEGWRLLRSQGWLDLLVDGGWPLWIGFTVLLCGTALIFLFQEALPLLYSRRMDHAAVIPEPPPELLARYEALLEGFRARGHFRWARPPRLQLIDEPRAIAAVRGLTDPRVVISTGIVARLDERELDGVIAHELAHVARGGNLVRLGLWLLRALQAPNPFALTLARAHFEANESACDALAAAVTGRPAALASALLKTRNRTRLREDQPALRRARLEVHRRSDLEATRARVLALLHDRRHTTVGLGDRFLFRLPRLILIGALLWSIG
ncbi:MAG: M56 family metallopeptidase [Deltaproteobacteria bacterium]|nr:M56 family metallopeptidase [Deltaproteobacteria bacterium]